MTGEGKTRRRTFGKHKGSVQAAEEQLLEGPILSCLLHMVPSPLYMDHSLLFSLLSNHTSTPMHSLYLPRGRLRCGDMTGGFHFTPLSLALPEGIRANPGVKEKAWIAIDFHCLPLVLHTLPATSWISRYPATSHLESHWPHIEQLLYLLLMLPNSTFLHDGVPFTSWSSSILGLLLQQLCLSCGQDLLLQLAAEELQGEETLPTYSLPWRCPVAEAQQMVMCPIGHLGLKAQTLTSKGPNRPPRCSFLRSTSHQGKPWMEKAKYFGWPPAAKCLAFGVQEGQTSWFHQLLPLNVCQTTAFPSFVLENARLFTRRVPSHTKYTHVLLQVPVRSIPHCLGSRFCAKTELLPCPNACVWLTKLGLNSEGQFSLTVEILVVF